MIREGIKLEKQTVDKAVTGLEATIPDHREGDDKSVITL